MSTKDLSDFDTNSVDGRLRLLLQELIGKEPNWRSMEHFTGTSSEKWRNFHRRQTKASVELIESIARVMPEYAFWLLTGTTDAEHGHISPKMTWWKREKETTAPAQREQAAKLFKIRIEISKFASEEIPAELQEKEQHYRRLREAEEKLLRELEQKEQQS